MRETIRYTGAAAIAVMMTWAVPAQAQDAQAQAAKTVKLDADRTFLMTAGQGGHAEVILAGLAAKKATSDDVKKLSQLIERDHSSNNKELKALADAKNVIVPTTLDAEHQQLYDRLEKLEGASFDQAYVAAMVDGHKKMITVFEQASVSKDPQIKAFAEKTLPALREHLKQSLQAQAVVGGATSTSGTKPTSTPSSTPTPPKY
jgi:putative membrane protein